MSVKKEHIYPELSESQTVTHARVNVKCSYAQLPFEDYITIVSKVIIIYNYGLIKYLILLWLIQNFAEKE